MSFRDRQRLDDITAAIDAIHAHLRRGDLTDAHIFDLRGILARPAGLEPATS